MKKKLLLVSSIIALVVMASVVSFADAPGRGHQKNPALELTQDQKDTMFKIRNVAEGDINAIKTDLKQSRYDLKKLLTANNVDEGQAQALHKKI